jgi:NADH-quinone oxidoreductase subunit J
MTVELILFGILALVAVLAALGMLLSDNAVHSALFLVLNFAAVALLYLTLTAPFLAMAQVTVYAGAIMVLFLFVIMLLGVERLRQPETRMRFQAPLAILLTVVLLAALGWVLLSQAGAQGAGAVVDVQAYTAPQQLAELLFSSYLLPFEVTSLLLLVAMIGVVVLTRTDVMPRRNPRVADARSEER